MRNTAHMSSACGCSRDDEVGIHYRSIDCDRYQHLAFLYDVIADVEKELEIVSVRPNYNIITGRPKS